MLSKSSVEFPYLSDGALGNETEWVAFPVLISGQDKTYAASLMRAKSAVDKLLDISKSLNSEKISISKAPIDDYKELETVVEFVKYNNECVSNTYNYIYMRFVKELELWEKMEIITSALDYICDLSNQYKSDKNVVVAVGVKYEGVK